VVKTIFFETEALLKLWDQDFIKNSEAKTWTLWLRLNTSKFVHCAENFHKNVFTTSKLNFFSFLAVLQPVLVVSYLHIQQRKDYPLNYRSFTKPYPCIIQSLKTIGLWPKPVAFETKKRPETFKMETHKSWDSITANNSNKVVASKKFLNLLT